MNRTVMTAWVVIICGMMITLAYQGCGSGDSLDGAGNSGGPYGDYWLTGDPVPAGTSTSTGTSTGTSTSTGTTPPKG